MSMARGGKVHATTTNLNFFLPACETAGLATGILGTLTLLGGIDALTRRGDDVGEV